MSERQPQLPEGVPPLSGYYVYLTGGCNLACKHCWLAPSFQPHGGTGGHLDYRLFELALEEGLPLGLQYVKLTGGEPLLHPDFVRMVELLREKKLGLIIETNGVLMTELMARYLKEESTLYHISVSLDGAHPHTHDNFRGVRGSFTKTCQAIRFLAEAGLRPQIIMSIHEGNVDEIEPLVRLAESLGARSVKFNLVQSSGRGTAMVARQQVLDIERLIETGRWVESKLARSTPLSLHFSWPPAFYGIERLLRSIADPCNLFNMIGILPNGALALCGVGVAVQELCFGMIGRDAIADVWLSHPTINALREELPETLEGVCSTCFFRDKCMGACVAQNYLSTRKLNAPFWFCQEAHEKGLFPATRLKAPDSFVELAPSF